MDGAGRFSAIRSQLPCPLSQSSDFHTWSKLAERKQAFICCTEQLLKEREEEPVKVTEADG